MKAVCWMGKKKVEVQKVDDPKILNPRDCIVRITSTAICESDLHLYDGTVPTMEKGDILGHEFMGEVTEVGYQIKKLRIGDRVVVPSTIACGGCHHCARQEWSCCDNTNPNSALAEALYGSSGAALFGYSHMMGGYAGGQAQYARVPFADVGPIKIESAISDEKVLFLSETFPTGYMAAENCNIERGRSVVAVWGCGPVGQFAIRSAFLLGAAKVVAIDNIPERLHMAEAAGAIALNDDDGDILERLQMLTGGRGPDAAIDTGALENHGSHGTFENVRHTLRLEPDRPHSLRQAMHAVRKGGTLSIPSMYSGAIDKISLGAGFNKSVTIKMGQTHTQRYLRPLLDLIESGQVDPSFVITHRTPLTEASDAYDTFAKKRDGCIKIVLDPSR